jgi:hypothetical protein
MQTGKFLHILMTSDKLTLRGWTKDFYEFPFQPIYIGNKRAKICVVSAPLYSNQIHVFHTLKQKGYLMLGISSYGHYPFVEELDVINDNRSEMLQKEEHKSVMKQMDGWLTCSRTPVLYDVPQLMFSESDCHRVNESTSPKGLIKKYDVIYNAASDGDFHQYHKNWKLAKECFQKMSDAGYTVLVLGRNAPADFELPGISYKPYLNWYEFLDTIEESRVLFVPNVSDASPRVLTEALCKGTPILVNKHIFGGWKYVNDCTGAFFESQDDVIPQLQHVLNAASEMNPRKWFLDTYYNDNGSVALQNLKTFIETMCGGVIPLEEPNDVLRMTEYKHSFDLPPIEMDDVKFIYVSVDTADNTPLCRHDLTEYVSTLNVQFKTHLKPDHWVVWPFYNSTGWGTKQDFEFVGHSEPLSDADSDTQLIESTCKCNGITQTQADQNDNDKTDYDYTVTLSPIEMDNIKFIYVSIDTADHASLCRHDLTAYVSTLNVKFKTHLKPHHWVVWLYYKTTGWGKKHEFMLP